jgi:hypothetical protein
MKQIILMLGTAVLLSAADQPRTFTGVITDTMCGKNHAAMNITPDGKCVQECVRLDPKKWKYALHDGQTMYTLSDQQTPEQFAGKKVKVTGVLYTKTGIIKVDKIEAAK